MKAKKLPVPDLCMMAIFTAIIAVMSWISIPLPYGVPLTLQTLAIPLTGVVLGAKKGTISTIVYVLLAIIGVPVLAGFQGGIGVVFGYTGGFILSFPVMTLTAGFGSAQNKRLWLWLGLAAGAVINYICGMIYFSIYMSTDLVYAFTACVLLFLPTDIIKIAVVGLYGSKIKNILAKGSMAK